MDWDESNGRALGVEARLLHGGPGSVRPAERIAVNGKQAVNERALTVDEQRLHNLRILTIHMAILDEADGLDDHFKNLKAAIQQVFATVNCTQRLLCESGKINERKASLEKYCVPYFPCHRLTLSSLYKDHATSL